MEWSLGAKPCHAPQDLQRVSINATKDTGFCATQLWKLSECCQDHRTTRECWNTPFQSYVVHTRMVHARGNLRGHGLASQNFVKVLAETGRKLTTAFVNRVLQLWSARPSGRARCSAGAGCSAIQYQSLCSTCKSLSWFRRSEVPDTQRRSWNSTGVPQKSISLPSNLMASPLKG